MAKIGFFTAVNFGDQPKSCTQWLLETVDSYFYLGGKKAYVIPCPTQLGTKGVLLRNDSPVFLITAFKVVSYLTIALPIVMLIVKVVHRSIHTFHIVDVKQKVEEGINISEATLEKIQKVMKREADEEIVWYKSRNLIFSLNSVPGLIFKAVNDADQRFDNMVKAQEVCLAHQLNLLIIPHAKRFNIGETSFIAEQRFDIQQDESAQESLYAQLSGLNETTRQLATFIAKTGFSDVAWRNMPIFNTDHDFPGSRQVILVDLEEMQDPATGIFGREDLQRRGLIRCLFSKEQIAIALAEAQRCGVASSNDTPEQVKAKRIEEVENYKKLQEFYSSKKISENPRQGIQISDLTTLGLNLQEKGHLRIIEVNSKNQIETKRKLITLDRAVERVIEEINNTIKQAPEAASAKATRCIRLNTDTGPLRDYRLIGNNGEDSVYSSTKDERTWIARIITALVAKGYLFQLKEVNDKEYIVQA